MNYFYPSGMMGYYGWGGMVMGLLFLIFIGVLIYAALKFVNTQREQGSTRSEAPMDILKKRYAKGEISKEEYDNIRKDL